MTDIIFFCYKTCSTCRAARKHLDAKGIHYQYREITTETPTVEELTRWIQESQLPMKRFYNTSGNLYKEMDLKTTFDSMTFEAHVLLLSQHGMLIKRPLLVHPKGIFLGYKKEVYDSL